MSAESEKFIREVYPEAKKMLIFSPVFTTAQGGLESGWGIHRVGNFGLFGEKCGGNWKGKKVLVTTTEIARTENELAYFKKVLPEIINVTPLATKGYYKIICKDWFKDFDSIKDCLDNHYALLTGTNFKHALVNAKDPIAFVKDLQDNKHNYATALNYVPLMCSLFNMVESTVKKYNL